MAFFFGARSEFHGICRRNRYGIAVALDSEHSMDCRDLEYHTIELGYRQWVAHY
jgi:hypothetical protein